MTKTNTKPAGIGPHKQTPLQNLLHRWCFTMDPTEAGELMHEIVEATRAEGQAENERNRNRRATWKRVAQKLYRELSTCPSCDGGGYIETRIRDSQGYDVDCDIDECRHCMGYGDSHTAGVKRKSNKLKAERDKLKAELKEELEQVRIHKGRADHIGHQRDELCLKYAKVQGERSRLKAECDRHLSAHGFMRHYMERSDNLAATVAGLSFDVDKLNGENERLRSKLSGAEEKLSRWAVEYSLDDVQKRADAWKAAYLAVNKLGLYVDRDKCTGAEFERIRDEASDARDAARALDQPAAISETDPTVKQSLKVDQEGGES